LTGGEDSRLSIENRLPHCRLAVPVWHSERRVWQSGSKMHQDELARFRSPVRRYIRQPVA
jgi:hypothetical protein